MDYLYNRYYDGAQQLQDQDGNDYDEPQMQPLMHPLMHLYFLPHASQHQLYYRHQYVHYPFYPESQYLNQEYVEQIQPVQDAQQVQNFLCIDAQQVQNYGRNENVHVSIPPYVSPPHPQYYLQYPFYPEAQPEPENLNQESVEETQPDQEMPLQTTYYDTQQQYPVTNVNVGSIPRLISIRCFNSIRNPQNLFPNQEVSINEEPHSHFTQTSFAAHSYTQQQPNLNQPEPCNTQTGLVITEVVEEELNSETNSLCEEQGDSQETLSQEATKNAAMQDELAATPTTIPLSEEQGGTQDTLFQEETEIAAIQEELTATLTTTPQYKENLWELLCKHCPAVSSVSSPLENHICDKSLVVSEDEERICNSCFMVIPNGMSLESHKTTRRHLLTVLNIKGDKIIEDRIFFYCYKCKIQCKTNNMYTEHLHSQGHAEIEEYNTYNLYICNVCDITMDKIAYEIHLSSTNHLLNSMISNIRSHYANNKVIDFDLACEICARRFVTEKSFKRHMSSLEHCRKQLDINLKNDSCYNYQYVLFDNENIICVLCNISIANRQCLPIHFLTDEHMVNVNVFEKNQFQRLIFGNCNLTTKLIADYQSCSDCKQLKRNCEHMFKNEKKYLTWKTLADEIDYCKYCNCIKNDNHESTKLHQKMLATVKYCQLCDKIVSAELAKHVNSRAHWISSQPLLEAILKKELRETLEKELKSSSKEEIEAVLNVQLKAALYEQRKKPFEQRRKIVEENGIYKRGPYKLFCGICNILSDTEDHHIQHLAGINHGIKYNTTCVEKVFHCRLCFFGSTKYKDYEDHLNSLPHLSKLYYVKKDFDHEKFCFICNRQFGQASITEHIKTDQHLEIIKLIGNTR